MALVPDKIKKYDMIKKGHTLDISERALLP